MARSSVLANTSTDGPQPGCSPKEGERSAQPDWNVLLCPLTEAQLELSIVRRKRWKCATCRHAVGFSPPLHGNQQDVWQGDLYPLSPSAARCREPSRTMTGPVRRLRCG